MAKKNSAFSIAQAAVMKAFRELERAIGVLPAAPAKKAKKKAPAKKKAAKKTKKRSK